MLVILAGCIKPYDPELRDDSVKKYVVEGRVSSVPGYQEVRVSLSSSIIFPKYIGVDGCEVEILDDLDQKYTCESFGDGLYKVWMNEEDLLIGTSYKVKIQTPEGEVLESVYDELLSGPDVGDINYEIEELPTNDPETWELGLQFYIDLLANTDDSRFYQWKLTETWEYHAAYPKEFYYDGTVNQIVPPDSSEMFCWISMGVDEIFTLSTKNLSENAFNQFPLHFVQNTTPRLGILYSLYLEQITLTENAYTYWDQLRQNSTNNGGLYNSQPMAIKGNLINTSNPNKDVLGYFQASTVTSRRIFVYPVENLEMDFFNMCDPHLLERGFVEINPSEYPAYLESDEGRPTMYLLNIECVDCTMRGGSVQKPNFWPL